MSGIVVMFQLDGAPIDKQLLVELTQMLLFRGPDAHDTKSAGSIGFGYTLLKTSESKKIESPFSVEVDTWIVADARIDAQDDLITKLKASGQEPGNNTTDAELILKAYLVWGEECINHLLGDFAFVIWDARRQCLFSARDQMGVKPLYYSKVGPTLILSNTLDCIRQHPAVSSTLNEVAIADFLMFGTNQTDDTTSFAAIRRLPSAHCATWTRTATTTRKYWTMPIDDPVYFKRDGDYSDCLISLLKQAVKDRLRTNRIGVFMSGGLDSSTLAAIAVLLLQDQEKSLVQAVTSVYDQLVPDSERYYAKLIAEHLDIPIYFDVRDNETSITNWADFSVHTPEPMENPLAFLAGVEFSKKISEYSRVFFYGEGPDNCLKYEWRSYISHLVNKRRLIRLSFDLAKNAFFHRRLPLISSIPRMLKDHFKTPESQSTFPDWFNEEMVSRLQLKTRWRECAQSPKSKHPIRPLSYQSMTSRLWQTFFEDCDLIGAWGHYEMRHPFVDLRLLRYLLAVPVLPWCRKKFILRNSVKHLLPGAAINRTKLGRKENPDFVRVRATGLPSILPTDEFLKYVDAKKVTLTPASPGEFRRSLRAISLEYWLRNENANTPSKRRSVYERSRPTYN